MPVNKDNIFTEESLARLTPERRALLQRLAEEQGISVPGSPAVAVTPMREEAPLSFAQQRLWFLEQLEPGSPLYIIPCAVRLRGDLSAPLLHRALALVAEHQPSLRTVFEDVNGEPRQRVVARISVPFDVVDLASLDQPARAQDVTRIARAEAEKPFDLAHGPLLRAVLLRLAERDHLLLLMMHHIIADGWSIGILLDECKECYRALASGRAPSLPPLTFQYLDYAHWQRTGVKEKDRAADLEYWKQRLGPATTVLDLVADGPRPASQSYKGAFELFSLSRRLTDQLRQLSQREGTTLFMTFTAAFMVLLSRYSGQNEFTLGTPVAGRTRVETERLIGFFVNTLVLRADLDGNPSFLQLLKRVRTTVLDAFAHGEVPFENVVEHLNVVRDMSRSPLFQHMIVLNNAPLGSLSLPDLEMSMVEIDNGTAKFDLVLSLTEVPEGVHGKLEFNTTLFQRHTARSLVERFQHLLGAIVATPDVPVCRLPLEEHDGAADRGQLTTPSAYAGTRLVHEEISGQSRMHAEKPALLCGGISFSYGELERRANRLAHILRGEGVGPEVRVAVCMERCAGSAVALLAILKAGGVYVPIDASYPEGRVRYILEDAGVHTVITSERHQPHLPGGIERSLLWDGEAGGSEEAPTVAVVGDNAAYVIYTSGSTGDPKGVVVNHGAIAAHCFDMRQFYRLHAGDKVLQFASFTFDASLEQLFCALGAGATVVMRGEGIWSIAELTRCITDCGLTVINLPTPYWHQMVREWHKDRTLIPPVVPRLVIAGGDTMQTDAVALWRELPTSGVRLLNAYGPTECVITATEYDVPAASAGSPEARIPIGLPLPGRAITIVDPDGEPVPRGIPGEIAVGGERLAHGYLGKAAETAASFTPDHRADCAGARLYRTGDRGRIRADGMLEFLGRVDDQVKVRGIRIEQGEIEAVLRRHPTVRDAAVLMREDRKGDRRLTAYVVPRNPVELRVRELLAHARTVLPSAMIPSAVVVMPALPMTAGGKLDRSLLPPPEPAGSTASEGIAPRTPVEQTLASLVAAALGVETVGITDNFFEQGGHSMLAMQVVAQVRQLFKVDIPLKALFEMPTVEGLARAIAQAQTGCQREEEVLQMLDDLERITDEEAAKIISQDPVVLNQRSANG